ncbi:MAG TPA: multidrug efflux SMR transporter [Acidimicrobiia bacterium]|jgi:quaternary ammonium compound-resistance protein SugE|nr:multidrug efflux SMR transporter [Acidimicrobiia bacterium]
MAWFILVVAGLLEVVWASLLPATRGFTRLWPSVGFLAALTASMVLLSLAVRDIPVGTAYAVWVGIGAVGAALAGVLIYGDDMSARQVVALALLVTGIVAVRLTSGE